MMRPEPGRLSAADAVGPAPLPLSVRGLTVDYGAGPVLRDLSVDVAPGRMVAIVGPNGAGKSTLIKAALGLVPAAAGEVRVFGQPFARVRQRVAHVPQRAAVDWDFPACVADVVEMGLWPRLGLMRRLRAADRAAIEAALDRVGLRDLAGRQIGRLSGGQQQRVFIARALVQGAELFLLDEPFAGVDAASEAAIVGVLHSLRDAGRSVVVVHHDLATVPAWFDDVLLVAGRTVAAGPVATAFTEAAIAETYGGRAPLRRS